MENPHDLTKVQKSLLKARQKLPLRAVARAGGARVTQTAGGKVQSPADGTANGTLGYPDNFVHQIKLREAFQYHGDPSSWGDIIKNSGDT